MEPMTEAVNGDTSSLLLMQEAQLRGYEVYQYAPSELSLNEGKPVARCRRVHIDLSQEVFFSEEKEQYAELSTFDVIHLRQHPPFNMEYITSTYLLEKVGNNAGNNTLVVNNPFWVRNATEKLIPLEFGEYAPPTIITTDAKVIARFMAEHGKAVIKPMWGFHGHDVQLLDNNHEDVEKIISSILKKNKEQVIVQKYLPEIMESGNKRILMVNGEIYGSVISKPAENFVIFRDSSDEPLKPNERDLEICAKLSPMLKERGMILVGIDIIGDYLIEVNNTCTGLYRINNVCGGKIETAYWDAIEELHLRA